MNLAEQVKALWKAVCELKNASTPVTPPDTEDTNFANTDLVATTSRSHTFGDNSLIITAEQIDLSNQSSSFSGYTGLLSTKPNIMSSSISSSMDNTTTEISHNSNSITMNAVSYDTGWSNRIVVEKEYLNLISDNHSISVLAPDIVIGTLESTVYIPKLASVGGGSDPSLKAVVADSDGFLRGLRTITDTNFGNTNITLTGDRAHNANYHNFDLLNLGVLRFISNDSSNNSYTSLYMSNGYMIMGCNDINYSSGIYVYPNDVIVYGGNIQIGHNPDGPTTTVKMPHLRGVDSEYVVADYEGTLTRGTPVAKIRLSESTLVGVNIPASTADPLGEVNDVVRSEDYLYVKTSEGWKRAALSTF